MDKVVYSIVVPVYNEELVIKESYIRLSNVMSKTKESYEIIFVNDGSRDKSKEQLQRICEIDKKSNLLIFLEILAIRLLLQQGWSFLLEKPLWL